MSIIGEVIGRVNEAARRLLATEQHPEPVVTQPSMKDERVSKVEEIFTEIFKVKPDPLYAHQFFGTGEARAALETYKAALIAEIRARKDSSDHAVRAAEALYSLHQAQNDSDFLSRHAIFTKEANDSKFNPAAKRAAAVIGTVLLTVALIVTFAFSGGIPALIALGVVGIPALIVGLHNATLFSDIFEAKKTAGRLSQVFLRESLPSSPPLRQPLLPEV
jgi:hypothetical protein